MSKCKGCGAEIYWMKTNSGKSIPVDVFTKDYWENENGKYQILDPVKDLVNCDLTGDPDKVTGRGFIAHKTTCTGIKDFKKKSDKIKKNLKKNKIYSTVPWWTN